MFGLMPGGAKMVDREGISCAELARDQSLFVESENLVGSEWGPACSQIDHVSSSGRSGAAASWGNVTYNSHVEAIQRLARLPSPLLIYGESGTGKTSLARMIHQASGRQGRLVIVNCQETSELADASWFDRVIQAAQGGTLLLDEVSDLSDEPQRWVLAMLLGAEQPEVTSTAESHRGVRIVATTAANLPDLICDRQVRKALFYRLSALSLQLTPLRDRRESIARYARDILATFAQRHGVSMRGLSPEALDLLNRHDWPGNIRELENVCQSAAMFGTGAVIGAHDIRLPVRSRSAALTAELGLAGRTLAEIERQAVIETLAACAGNKALTARTLGISEKSIYNKMRRHKIQL